MKVSGAHIEEISAWTNMGYESAEKIRIQTTVEKLAKEGKHVINIIHGNKTMVGGDYAKTITFLWEADDEDVAYKSFIEKEENIAKERLQFEAEKKDLLSAKRGTESRISILRERIDNVEKYSNDNIGIDEFVKKEKARNLGVAFFCLISGALLIALGIFAEIFIITAIGALFALASFSVFYSAFSKSEEDTAKYKYENSKRDAKNIESLKKELESEKKKLAEINKRLNELNNKLR